MTPPAGHTQTGPQPSTPRAHTCTSPGDIDIAALQQFAPCKSRHFACVRARNRPTAAYPRATPRMAGQHAPMPAWCTTPHRGDPWPRCVTEPLALQPNVRLTQRTPAVPFCPCHSATHLEAHSKATSPSLATRSAARSLCCTCAAACMAS
eukprot:363464-Chlamydomonas_euryale.AAC.8